MFWGKPNQRGQTLIIVFAVMVIALGIGISASSRLIGALRSASRADLSARTLAAAEAGAEQFLSLSFQELSDYITYDSCGSACQTSITGVDGLVSTIDISLSFEGNSSDPYFVTLKPGEITEVFLEGYPPNTPLSICLTETPSGNPPVVMTSFVYGIQGSYDIANTMLQSFGCHTISGRNNPVSLRIKSIYEEIEARVTPQAGTELPSQGIIIESSAQLNDIVRTVRVLKGYSTLPAEFNYVLYSKSETEPLSN